MNNFLAFVAVVVLAGNVMGHNDKGDIDSIIDKCAPGLNKSTRSKLQSIYDENQRCLKKAESKAKGKNERLQELQKKCLDSAMTSCDKANSRGMAVHSCSLWNIDAIISSVCVPKTCTASNIVGKAKLPAGKYVGCVVGPISTTRGPTTSKPTSMATTPTFEVPNATIPSWTVPADINWTMPAFSFEVPNATIPSGTVPADINWTMPAFSFDVPNATIPSGSAPASIDWTTPAFRFETSAAANPVSALEPSTSTSAVAGEKISTIGLPASHVETASTSHIDRTTSGPVDYVWSSIQGEIVPEQAPLSRGSASRVFSGVSFVFSVLVVGIWNCV